MGHLSVQLVALGDHCESLKMKLSLAGNRLATMTQLIAVLVRLTSKMSKEEYMILQGVLCSQVDQQVGMQGWEERTQAAITQMLRTVLAKSPKEQNGTATIPLGKSGVLGGVAVNFLVLFSFSVWSVFGEGGRYAEAEEAHCFIL